MKHKDFFRKYPKSCCLTLCLALFFSLPITSVFAARDISLNSTGPMAPEKKVDTSFEYMDHTEEELTSLDFLNDSPLRQKVSESTAANHMEKENCRQSGSTEEGRQLCEQIFKNGERRKIITDYASSNTETKIQTVQFEFNSFGKQIARNSIRQKSVYRWEGEQKILQTEYFDFIHRPGIGKITRQMVIKEYKSSGQDLDKVTWSRYEQIQASATAKITHYAVLRYDEDNQPAKAKVLQWNSQEDVQTLLDWRKPEGVKPDSFRFNYWQERIFNLLLEAPKI